MKVKGFLIFLLLFLGLSSLNPPDIILEKAKWVKSEVEAIRRLSFETEPKFIIITREDAKLLFGPAKPNERLKLWEKVYKLTFILPPEASLFKEKTESKAGWIATTVDSKVYIIRENFMVSEDVSLRTLAHELVHILQKSLNATYSGKTLDSTLAMRALIEGDADLVADMFCIKNGIRIYKIRNISREDLYWSLNVFPYVFGDSFVAYLYQKGGWELVNKSYKNPPKSTKAVIFPELYLSNWSPIEVEISPIPGEPLLDDTLGAYYVFLVSWKVYNWNESMEIARGWEGDKIILTKDLLIWKVAFSEKDSAWKFYLALKKLANSTRIAKYEIKISNSTVLLEAQLVPPSS